MAQKIALITGGSRGLGKEMALRLAEKGNDVVVTYVSQKEAAENVVKDIEAMGRQAIALPLDTNDIAALPQFISEFKNAIQNKWHIETFDFLVNNAGIGANIPFEEATEEQFDQFLNIHFKSVFFLTQQLLPFINDHGRVINISTGTTRFCVPGYTIYASMKGAIEVFTRYLAKDSGSRGITVNVVAPGPVETDFNNGGNRDIPERKNLLASRTALGRVGLPKDIGGIIAFLCSEDGGWINGQRIEVTGGINL